MTALCLGKMILLGWQSVCSSWKITPISVEFFISLRAWDIAESLFLEACRAERTSCCIWQSGLSKHFASSRPAEITDWWFEDLNRDDLSFYWIVRWIVPCRGYTSTVRVVIFRILHTWDSFQSPCDHRYHHVPDVSKDLSRLVVNVMKPEPDKPCLRTSWKCGKVTQKLRKDRTHLILYFQPVRCCCCHPISKNGVNRSEKGEQSEFPDPSPTRSELR